MGTRIRRAREAKGLRQHQIAEKMGIKPSAVSQWETDKSVPEAHRLPELADYLSVTVDYLLGKTAAKPHINSPVMLDRETMPRDVEVRGTASCGDGGGGAFTFDMSSTPIDYVRRPPRLAGITDAYALYVQGSSMSPWREEGQLVYVHPRQPAQVGDYVVVQALAKDGETREAFLKRLVRRTATELRLMQFNPHGEIMIPVRRVVAIHRVIDWSELLGV